MLKTLSTLKDEIYSYSLTEKLFILCVMLCGFCITGEYSIAKPVSYSVFISTFGSSFFPYVWLAAIPVNLFVVFLYNKALPKLGCLKMVILTTSIVALGNAISSQLLVDFPRLSFIHFIWKDIYVLLMFQHLWSVIHSTISFKRAKYLYGIIYSVGGLGSVIGSMVPGFFAIKTGSENLLLSSLIFYTLFVGFYYLALEKRNILKNTMEGVGEINLNPKDTSGGFQLIYRSKYLLYILLIVIFMQMSASLIDFQFNTFLESMIPQKDLRTSYYGKLFACIHFINLGLQVGGTFFIVHLLGLKNAHIAVPIFFALNIISFIVMPIFPVVIACFGSIKSCDYSVFGIIKEMLYIPLQKNEKFKAKAVIDVFAYRSSKAVSSLILLGLQTFTLMSVTTSVSWILLGICIVWSMCSFYFLREPKELSKA